MLSSRYLSYYTFFLLLFTLSCGSDDDGGMELKAVKAPRLQFASEVMPNSFRITWTEIADADRYEVDIATDENFTQFVMPYNAWRENGAILNVTGLETMTTYYVRVRSVRGTEISVNSNIVLVTTNEPAPPVPEGTLKDAATTFLVGMAVQSGKLNGSYATIYNREFNSFTAEWEMKMNIMYPSAGNYDFSRVDQIVDYAEANNISVHGHTLIWHSATPSWITNFSGTNEEFEAIVKDYIMTTVGRYKGRIKSWDVVNEAFEDGSGNLRNSVFRQKMGNDYVAKCHQWVREADPDVLIFYNDYNMTVDDTKLNAVLAMADDFISRGIPLDGLGYQMHISYNGPSKSRIESAAKKTTDRDLKLHFSELDIRANPNNDLTNLTQQREIDQQAKVREVVEIYNAIPANSKYALTVWGLKDNESWLLDFWGHVDWPLLYDRNFEAKRAHIGFLEGLQ